MIDKIKEIQNQYKLQIEKMSFRIKELEEINKSKDILIKNLGEKIANGQ
jgi:hypothetical protein